VQSSTTHGFHDVKTVTPVHHGSDTTIWTFAPTPEFTGEPPRYLANGVR
jgi:hypothetical protein